MVYRVLYEYMRKYIVISTALIFIKPDRKIGYGSEE